MKKIMMWKILKKRLENLLEGSAISVAGKIEGKENLDDREKKWRQIVDKNEGIEFTSFKSFQEFVVLTDNTNGR